jgi:hypothetical protein
MRLEGGEGGQVWLRGFFSLAFCMSQLAAPLSQYAGAMLRKEAPLEKGGREMNQQNTTPSDP